jgi:hypothetical protein
MLPIASKVITITIDPKLEAWLRKKAEAEGLTVSAYRIRSGTSGADPRWVFCRIFLKWTAASPNRMLPVYILQHAEDLPAQNGGYGTSEICLRRNTSSSDKKDAGMKFGDINQ